MVAGDYLINVINFLGYVAALRTSTNYLHTHYVKDSKRTPLEVYAVDIWTKGIPKEKQEIYRFCPIFDAWSILVPNCRIPLLCPTFLPKHEAQVETLALSTYESLLTVFCCLDQVSAPGDVHEQIALQWFFLHCYNIPLENTEKKGQKSETLTLVARDNGESILVLNEVAMASNLIRNLISGKFCHIPILLHVQFFLPTIAL